MGLLPLNYRRPAHVDKNSLGDSESISGNSDNEKSDVSLRSGRSGSTAGIPLALAFDRIIDGGTCPPCTTRDFLNYLIYIEHAAENLQFFLWYRDYVKRFREAKTPDVGLASEWTQAMEDEALARLQKDARKGPGPRGPAADMLKGTDFDAQGGGHGSAALTAALPTAGGGGGDVGDDSGGRQGVASPDGGSGKNPFRTPPHTAQDESQQRQQGNGSDYNGSNAMSYRSQATDAFSAAGVNQPFTIQPFRGEINRVIATYIMTDAPRQLNLSDREQKVVMQALAYTTHPTAFRSVARTVETSLRRQLHPNFIRWTICNGNSARVWFARWLGIGLVVGGIVLGLLLALSHVARGWRAFAALAWVLGMATLIAGYKGMCVVLHGMHHRHVRPWELFVADDENEEMKEQAGGSNKPSFDSFGSSNSYEDQPWVVKYQKRNILRKIFDREVWIEEPALRQIQDTIFVQSMLSALVFGAILTAIFVVVPGGNFF